MVENEGQREQHKAPGKQQQEERYNVFRKILMRMERRTEHRMSRLGNMPCKSAEKTVSQTDSKQEKEEDRLCFHTIFLYKSRANAGIHDDLSANRL